MSKMKQPWHSKASLLQNTLVVLKQRQGASLAQIRKRLQLKSSNGKVDASKNKMLTTALKGLVEKGKIEKNSGIYKLAKSNLEEDGVPSRRHILHRRRRRGTPRRRRRRRSRRRHSRRRRHTQRRHHRRRRHCRRRR